MVSFFLGGASLVAQKVKRLLPAMQETWVRSLGREDRLEKEMATHSRIFAWRIRGQRSLVGYSPLGCKESDTTEQLNFTNFSKYLLRAYHIPGSGHAERVKQKYSLSS